MLSGGMASSAATAAAAAVSSSSPTPTPEELAGTIKGIGVTGSLLYTAMLLFVGWRTRAFFKAGGDGSPPGVFPAKTFFHLFLLASCLSDLPYYYKLGGGEVSKASYSLHLVAILLDLCAFSMLCVAWSRPLQISRDQDRVLTTVLALDSFVLIYTFVVIALVIISSTDVDHFVASSPQPYLFFFLVHGLALLVFCLWLLAFGVRLQRAIRAHPRWEPVRRERRLLITARINGVLFICGACFLLRVALLLAHFLQAEAGDERAMLAPGAIVSWYLFATWIPFVVPACTLLYMMRPGTALAGGGSAQAAATVGLISSPSHKVGHAHHGSNGNGSGGRGDWALLDEPLVSPTVNTQPLAARAFFARLQKGNLYSPPAAAGPGGGGGGGAGKGGGGEGRERRQNGKGTGMGDSAILDLGDDDEEEEGMGGVDAEKKDERTSSSLAAAAAAAAAAAGGDEAAMPLKRMDVEAV